MSSFSETFQCSSASRKFLNGCGSIENTTSEKFQCSSASRKFLNEMRMLQVDELRRAMFQCSSASRKFLNSFCVTTSRRSTRGFSALQRAENSSIGLMLGISVDEYHVSVLFSEPKIPQSPALRLRLPVLRPVSVLFSEPKIPQCVVPVSVDELAEQRVSVLFSEPKIPQCLLTSTGRVGHLTFQCSSASRKFLNGRW